MKILSIIGWSCLIAAGLTCGCSKKAATPEATTAATPAEPEAATGASPRPAEAGVADGGYDAKVAVALQATSGVPMSEAQKEAAARAEKQLLDAVEKDPQAAEAYKNLQRLRNGR